MLFAPNGEPRPGRFEGQVYLESINGVATEVDISLAFAGCWQRYCRWLCPNTQTLNAPHTTTTAMVTSFGTPPDAAAAKGVRARVTGTNKDMRGFFFLGFEATRGWFGRSVWIFPDLIGANTTFMTSMR